MRRALRTALLALAALLLAAGFALASTSPAYAASDQIDTIAIE